MPRFCRKWSVQRNKIGGGEQFIQFLHQLDLQAARTRRGKVRINRQHPHSESNRAATQFASDPAHADNPERLVIELNALEFFPVPTAAF